ncbi:MAG: hypothetical protein ACM3O9_05895 [Methylocystaceae bacterium]
MPETKCEYPCSLDLWANVVKAKHIACEVTVFESVFCVPLIEVGGIVENIEYIQARVISAHEEFGNNKVSLQIAFELILLVLVSNEPHIITINHNYEQTIPVSDFCPPLTPMELRDDVSDSAIILNNWKFEWAILGRCDDSSSPCFTSLTTPVAGTCLSLTATVDIIDKLFKPHDIIVYAELDPDDSK